MPASLNEKALQENILLDFGEGGGQHIHGHVTGVEKCFYGNTLLIFFLKFWKIDQMSSGAGREVLEK